MTLNVRILCASFLVGIGLGTASVVLDGCGAAHLTPEEASAELDVACSALVRTLVEHEDDKAAAVTNAVCRAEQTRTLIRKAAEHFDQHDAGPLLVVDFPDGGSHGP